MYGVNPLLSTSFKKEMFRNTHHPSYWNNCIQIHVNYMGNVLFSYKSFFMQYFSFLRLISDFLIYNSCCFNVICYVPFWGWEGARCGKAFNILNSQNSTLSVQFTMSCLSESWKKMWQRLSILYSHLWK